MGTITHIDWPTVEPEGWPPIRGTYCPPRPLDGLPELTVDDPPFWPWRKCIRWALGLSALFWLFVALSYLTMRAM